MEPLVSSWSPSAACSSWLTVLRSASVLSTVVTHSIPPHVLRSSASAPSASSVTATLIVLPVSQAEAYDGSAEAAASVASRSSGVAFAVSVVEKSDADLNEVNQELQAALGDQLLTSGSMSPDSLDAQVVYDDGSVQEWADATYGDGLVTISSALEPTA